MDYIHVKNLPVEYQLGRYEFPRARNPFSCKYEQPILSVLYKTKANGLPKFRCNFIYLVGLGIRGPIKIGRAKCPKTRLSGLQTANPKQLTLLALVFDPNNIWEDRFHKEFAVARIRGEWFKRSRELQDFLYWLRKFQIKPPVWNNNKPRPVHWSDWDELHKSQKLG